MPEQVAGHPNSDFAVQGSNQLSRGVFLRRNPTPLPSRASPYTPAMYPAKMNELLARMKPEEIRDGLWMIGVFEDWGSMSAEEADEWRRRMVARQRFLEPDGSASAGQ